MHPRRRTAGTSAASATKTTARRGAGAPPGTRFARRRGDGARAVGDRASLELLHGFAVGRTATISSTIASGRTSRYAGRARASAMCGFAIAVSDTPSTSPAAIARSGEPKRTTSAATRPLSPSKAPVSTSTVPLGAATIAATAASPPASPKASATNVSTGTPTIRAPSASEAIACRPRPKRVRSSAQRAGCSEGQRERDDEERADLQRGAAERDEAGVPEVAKGERVGEDVAGAREDGGEDRADREGHSSVAATQPIVEPRDRYGWTAKR